jgi:hypothetical protein
MPSNIVKSFAKKTGKPESEIEFLYIKAKAIAKDEGRKESDEDFYPYVTGILKKMLSIKEDLSEEDYLDLIAEMTGTSSVAMPQGPLGAPTGKMNCGTPFFDCDEDQFFNLHRKARQSGQWWKKHYKDTNMAQWAKKNKGKNFYLRHKGMFRKIKAN